MPRFRGYVLLHTWYRRRNFCRYSINPRVSFHDAHIATYVAQSTHSQFAQQRLLLMGLRAYHTHHIFTAKYRTAGSRAHVNEAIIPLNSHGYRGTFLKESLPGVSLWSKMQCRGSPDGRDPEEPRRFLHGAPRWVHGRGYTVGGPAVPLIQTSVHDLWTYSSSAEALVYVCAGFEICPTAWLSWPSLLHCSSVSVYRCRL